MSAFVDLFSVCVCVRVCVCLGGWVWVVGCVCILLYVYMSASCLHFHVYRCTLVCLVDTYVWYLHTCAVQNTFLISLCGENLCEVLRKICMYRSHMYSFPKTVYPAEENFRVKTYRKMSAYQIGNCFTHLPHQVQGSPIQPGLTHVVIIALIGILLSTD